MSGADPGDRGGIQAAEPVTHGRGLPPGEHPEVVRHWHRLIADEPGYDIPPLWPELLVLSRLMADWDGARRDIADQPRFRFSKGAMRETPASVREGRVANQTRLAAAGLSTKLASWQRRLARQANHESDQADDQNSSAKVLRMIHR